MCETPPYITGFDIANKISIPQVTFKLTVWFSRIHNEDPFPFPFKTAPEIIANYLITETTNSFIQLVQNYSSLVR